MNAATFFTAPLYNPKDNPNAPSTATIRAYLGGSFNPVHNGHIQMAMQVYNCLLPLAHEQQRKLHVYLLPNARSPFKQQTTKPEHRLAMLKLAIQDTPLHINELELWQNPPVYTIDSVRALRAQYPRDSLIFIMGMDSAHSLDQWKNGLQLTDYVHLWVFNRCNKTDKLSHKLAGKLTNERMNELTDKLPNALKAQVTDSPDDLLLPNCLLPNCLLTDYQYQRQYQQQYQNQLLKNKPLKNQPKGRIYIDPRPIARVSSTQIRQQLQANVNINPDNINSNANANANANADNKSASAVINTNKVMKCLHPAVYHYIITHQLYSAAQFR